MAVSGAVEYRTASAAPLLSVVVPIYRVERFLPDCLDSLLSCVGSEIEVVAVDDASPDGCPGILDKYASNDPRLRVVHLPANVGLGQARNAGIECSRGRYVWFVDGDDWLPGGALRAVLDRLSETEPDVLVVDHAEVFPDGSALVSSSAELLRGLALPIQLSQQPRLLRLAQSACTKIARRGLLHEAGLRFRPGWYEDSSFSHPLLLAARRIDALDQICYCYRRQSAGSITTTVSRKHFDVFDQYEHVFAVVTRAADRYSTFVPELFRLMVNHYLVILGNDWRLPDNLRRSFFRRAVEHYVRWCPEAGYSIPGGIDGLKHRLLRHNAYRSYTALRSLHRALGRRLPTLYGARRQLVTISDDLAPPSLLSATAPGGSDEVNVSGQIRYDVAGLTLAARNRIDEVITFSPLDALAAAKLTAADLTVLDELSTLGTGERRPVLSAEGTGSD
jgi:glycosyltransferase involved in cell wall biosynthesis